MIFFFAGGMASGVQVAISMSNTGGAWDNAKKYIERATPDSELQGKGSDIHKVSLFFFVEMGAELGLIRSFIVNVLVPYPGKLEVSS